MKGKAHILEAANLINNINTKLDEIQKCLNELLKRKSSNGSKTTSDTSS